MANDFSRLITLLRKERGESQKQVALSLGISQALLSHYEKGIRECGLDFLCRCADYYNVSTDYLLGRDSRRRPDDDKAEGGETVRENVLKGSVYPALGKALTTSSVNMMFDLLSPLHYRRFAGQVQKYINIVLYKIFRYYYCSNPENESAFFAVKENLFPELCSSALFMSELKLKEEASALAALSRKEDFPAISYDSISSKSPQNAAALLNLLKNAENELTGQLSSKK